MRDLDVTEVTRALAACQNIALFKYPALQLNARKMLFALDRFWQADEGRSPSGWDRLWWETYERHRARVESDFSPSPPTGEGES